MRLKFWLLGLSLFLFPSSASAKGYLGTTGLSILDSAFCKKYQCKFLKREVMPNDYDIANATIYEYKVSTEANVITRLLVTRVKGKVIGINLPEIFYHDGGTVHDKQRNSEIIPPILRDFFILATGSNTNPKLWEVYQYCGNNMDLPYYYAKGLLNVGGGYFSSCGVNLLEANYSIYKSDK